MNEYDYDAPEGDCEDGLNEEWEEEAAERLVLWDEPDVDDDLF